MIRHAKSSWANPLQSDFERPLNDRGEHDAPLMGARLKELGIKPDLIISSPAKRAKQTAKRIADVLGYQKDDIKYIDKLYHCIPAVFEEVIYETDNSKQTMFIVAHNPGITDFVNELSDKFQTDNMATCAVVGVKIEAEEWSDYKLAKKEVFLYEYPKKLYGDK
jgi:phosphohistidine phosphatase